MAFQKNNLWIIISVIFGVHSTDATEAFAMGREGHGGVAIVCRSESKVTSVNLLDLVEGRDFYRYAPGPTGLSFKQAIQRALGRISDLPVLTERLRAELDWITRYSAPFPNFDQMELTHDFTPKVTPKEGCKFELLARYEPDSSVSFNEKLTKSKAFTPYERATLLVHEAIYRMDRVVRSAAHSDEARRLTALLVSSESEDRVNHEFTLAFGSAAVDPREFGFHFNYEIYPERFPSGWNRLPWDMFRTAVRSNSNLPIDVRFEARSEVPVDCIISFNYGFVSMPFSIDASGLRVVLGRLPEIHSHVFEPKAQCTGPAHIRSVLVQQGGGSSLGRRCTWMFRVETKKPSSCRSSFTSGKALCYLQIARGLPLGRRGQNLARTRSGLSTADSVRSGSITTRRHHGTNIHGAFARLRNYFHHSR